MEDVRRLAIFALLLSALPVFAVSTTVTLLHFSDYHSHAQPSYSESRADQGGIARAIGYLERHKREGALVFNGGDMMNRGAPAWSDKYGCVEWEWLNGIVDAMAFGNHDADYGADAFARCTDRIKYPILSANTDGFQPSAIFERGGVRIGVFAVAGADYSGLIKVPELKFSDPVEAARATVKRLRETDHVDAVVMIGHEHQEADFALARVVPGIDVIFGTHTHAKRELTKIPQTETWFISPFQYLTYISRIELSFTDRKLTNVSGSLVRVDSSMKPDVAISNRVAKMQKQLQADPQYRDLFVVFASLTEPMALDSLEKFTVDLMREAAGADVAVSTVSSFRQALPRGAIDLETLRGALPYDNELLVADLPIASYRRLVELAEERRGTDARFITAGGPVPGRDVVTVATTDYLAHAPGYRDVFAGVPLRSTGKRVRQLVRDRIASGAREP